MRRIDPDALYGFILNRWGQAVAAQVCPEVEPERTEPGSDRCGCAMFGYIHARRECDAYRDKPAEPVIDEAVFEAAGNHPVDASSGWRGSITAAVLKDRELRSNACGSVSSCSSLDSFSAASAIGGGTPSASETNAAAPAADPRRLDAEDALAVYWRGWHSVKTERLTAALRAVADAQFEKALRGGE